MNQSINPYEPAGPAVDDRTRLKFESVIEFRDYAKLLPYRDFEKGQKWFLVGVFVLVSVGLASAFIPELFKIGSSVGMGRIAVASLVMLAGALFVFGYIWTGLRARRKLWHNPDLLGIARGELNESGMVFHDGTRQHWFGPQFLASADVSNDGVRVYLGEDPNKAVELEPRDFAPDRYLALTARMFDGYKAEVAQQLKERWGELQIAGVKAGWEAWTELNPAPQDAIAFGGRVTQTETMQTPENANFAVRESLIIAGGIVLVALSRAQMFSSAGNWVIIAIVPFLLYDNVQRWWQFFRACNSVTVWNQRGWISPREFAIVKDSRGVRLSLDEVANCVDHDDYLEMTMVTDSTYFIARDQVASDDDWTQVVNICRGTLSKPQCHRDRSRSVSFSKGSS